MNHESRISLLGMCITGLLLGGVYANDAGPANGPLRVCMENPRYFTNGSGKAIYLVGSHTWNNLKDTGDTPTPAPFDYEAYLDMLVRFNHNFIRLWTWELAKYSYAENQFRYKTPFPWPRTGSVTALDGSPRFDLNRFDQAYFHRLRSRVVDAGERGIYVSIMLFEGHGMQFSLPSWCWDGHPFNRNNNINGIDGDRNGDGRGTEIHTLEMPAVTRIQEAYVRKVIDTVNDLDNVLFEIANESGPSSTDWQYHMINYIREYEKDKPKQHSIGMTFQYRGGSNSTLFESPADWVSPNHEGGYRNNPPDADGAKVIITDTDHLWGIGGNQSWVWKSFLRGMNPIFMDPYLEADKGGWLDPEWDPVRRSMGYTRTFAERIDLVKMKPSSHLSSTEYCLANPGEEYLVYLPEGGMATLELSAAAGRLDMEWFNPSTGETIGAGTVLGGAKREFVAPFDGDAVLYVWSGTPNCLSTL
ncbi:MAG: hypothetical protein KAT18_05015 [Candidatus Latescibacteria bacterium]|nr:hypothetical protein [Candidatus Latescibacterota bacterium]